MAVEMARPARPFTYEDLEDMPRYETAADSSATFRTEWPFPFLLTVADLAQ